MGAGRNPALGAEGGQKEATATGGEGRRDRQTQGGSKATRPQKSFLWNWKDLGLVPGDRRAEATPTWVGRGRLGLQGSCVSVELVGHWRWLLQP